MKPMLASPLDNEKYPLKFPCFVSPKMDGVRAYVKDSVLISRSGKLIRNEYVQEILGKGVLNGLDGELCVGNPWDKNLMQQTTSGVMTIEGEPKFCWHVFDCWGMAIEPAHVRFNSLKRGYRYPDKLIDKGMMAFVEQPVVNNMEELNAYEEKMLAIGYEGVIVRGYDNPYKYGRSTAREQGMLKVKRFVSSEARVTGFVELQHNLNEATKDAYGNTKRSSHQENKVGGDTLGTLVGVDIRDGRVVEAGTGFDAAMRKIIWKYREKYLGSIFTYKHFPHGVKDKPRHPVFVAFRHPEDMS